MKTTWSKNNFARLMNEAGDGAGGGDAAAAGDAGNAGDAGANGGDAAAAGSADSAGYQDTANQAAAGYQQHQAAESKEVKFDKTGHDEKSIELIQTYAAANELTEKQTEGFAKFIKGLKERSESAKNQSAEQAKAAQFTKMQADFKMLKEHPEFGKDTEKSFMEAGKVLDLMPDLKKQLTVDGKHIDPIIMISLKSLYSKLYGQDGVIVQGGKTDTEDNRPDHDKIYGKYDKK